MRIEVQAERSRLRKIVSKYEIISETSEQPEIKRLKRQDGKPVKSLGIYDFKLKSWLSCLGLSNTVLAEEYSRFIGSGDFMKKRLAVALIEKSDHTKNIKGKLKRTVSMLELYGNVYDAKTAFTSMENNKDGRKFSGSEQSWNSYIKKLRNLGIHPSIIPNAWSVSSLPNNCMIDTLEHSIPL